MKMNYLGLCCIVKDENSYLGEWIRYHKKIGVERFYIYDNESKKPIFETLREENLLDNVYVSIIPGKGVQCDAYMHCLQNFGSECRWIGAVDTDEFIVPKATNDLRKFLQEYEGFGGLGINWFIFGSSGHKTRPSGLQIENFLWRASADSPGNTHIKTIYQSQYTLGAADPHHFIYKDGFFCVNERYLPIFGSFSPPRTEKIQLNHYFLRSEAEFKEKIARGLAYGVGTRTMQEFYIYEENSNLIRDDFILQFLPI